MFLSLKIVFILANSKDPDEIQSYATFWVYTVCQNTCLAVPRMKRVNTNRNCLGQFHEILWNQTTDVHRGSTLIKRVIMGDDVI